MFAGKLTPFISLQSLEISLLTGLYKQNSELKILSINRLWCSGDD